MGRSWIYILKSYAIVLLFLSQSAVAQDQLFDKVIAFQTMSQRWELDSIHKKGTFRMTPYKPIYVTIVRWESNPNKQPFSENTNYIIYGNKYTLAEPVISAFKPINRPLKIDCICGTTNNRLLALIL